MNKGLQIVVVALFLGYMGAAFFYPDHAVQVAASVLLALVFVGVPFLMVCAWLLRTYMIPRVIYREKKIIEYKSRKRALKFCKLCKKNSRCRVQKSPRGFWVHRMR